MADYIPVGEPKNEAERIAIRSLRDRLPDHFIVIGNFELSLPQRANSLEFDAVVIGEHGLFAVEIKGWSGKITGTPRRWVLEWGTVESPLIRIEEKAKALRHFLVQQLEHMPEDVFVEPVVLLPYSVDLDVDDPRDRRVIGCDDVWDFLVDVERIRERGPGPMLDTDFRESVHLGLMPWAKASRNRVILPNYEIVAELETTGGHSEFIARHKRVRTRGEVRIKRYAMDPLVDGTDRDAMTKEILREMEALAALDDNPYVARAYDLVTDTDDDHLIYIIMEWVGKESLGDVIGRFHAGSANLDPYELAEHMLRALDFIHRRGIIHRELRPECFHMRPEPGDGPPFKIVDFDHARVSDVSSLGSALSDLQIGYTAPELWASEEHDHRVDYFSAGAIIFELFVGKRLFDGLADLMKPGPRWLAHRDRVEDHELRLVLDQLLAPDPEDRPDSISDFVDFFAVRKKPTSSS